MQWAAAAGIARDLCKIPFPHDSRNPNTGFQLFSPQIPPNSTQIPPGCLIIGYPGRIKGVFG
ncbi:hypothetical protein EHH59_11110 [Neisseria meningitidis]|nr:hypothetical protein EHH59_11110 [Neisseria meningitidis]